LQKKRMLEELVLILDPLSDLFAYTQMEITNVDVDVEANVTMPQIAAPISSDVLALIMTYTGSLELPRTRNEG
jgi:hypothetical protein